eukprot:EG_transcript_22138
MGCQGSRASAISPYSVDLPRPGNDGPGHCCAALPVSVSFRRGPASKLPCPQAWGPSLKPQPLEKLPWTKSEGTFSDSVAEPEEAEGESSAGSLYAWGVQYDGSASASIDWDDPATSQYLYPAPRP